MDTTEFRGGRVDGLDRVEKLPNGATGKDWMRRFPFTFAFAFAFATLHPP
jgi:hypothetical protein